MQSNMEENYQVKCIVQNKYDKIEQGKIPKWNIILNSDNCTAKRHFEGWQICPKIKTKIEEDFQLCVNVSQPESSIIEGCMNSDAKQVQVDVEEGEENTIGKIALRKCLNLLNNKGERINFILRVLTKAVNERKTFVIVGIFPVLRGPLTRRGWIEKKSIRKMISIAPDMNEGGLEQVEKLLRDPAGFIWYTNKKSVGIRSDDKTIFNKFAGSYFTSKVDMCDNLENIHWYYEEGVSDVSFPRCYNVYRRTQVEEFIQDYYMTACFGLLKWVLFIIEMKGMDGIWSPNGTVPMNTLLFALQRCVDCTCIHTHGDIDEKNQKEASPSEWSEFLIWYSSIINEGAIFKQNETINLRALVMMCVKIYQILVKYRVQDQIDGMRNIWILKPGDKSLGRGIVIKNSLSEILSKINQVAKESTQFVIQKYIERPLLVHGTKIDIRQWFLITNNQPLVVWMYKDILIRFASKGFNLDDFHESIHLCNTTVQLKYRKYPKQNTRIPYENHWNLEDFKGYLKSINKEFTWEKIIRPGIKVNLIGALLASQDSMVYRKNSFQLYGADFVVCEDFSVWLIEINTNPRLNPPSSTVTSKLYPEVIEDTLKVVLDRCENVNGNFECIYKQHSQLFRSKALGQGTYLGIKGTGLSATIKSPRNN